MKRWAAASLAVLALGVSWPALRPLSRAALAQAPDREGAYRANNVGVAYMEQYQFEPAVERFRKAVALDPQFATARVGVQRIGDVEEISPVRE